MSDCFSQTDVTKSFGDKYDFSEFLATNKDVGLDGVFDETYHRIQFAFIKIEKSLENKLIYKITGADRLKGVVTQFVGTIQITKITKNEGNLYFPTKPSDDKMIDFEAIYEFRENKESKGSGIFKGALSFSLTLEKNKFLDNMSDYMGDGFSNFIYYGTWTSYLTGKTKKCILGEGRLPDTGDFDQGDGMVIVNDKYKQNGWATDKDFRLLDNPKHWWTK
jgi:hypothetical protein